MQRDIVRAHVARWELVRPEDEDYVPDTATALAAKLSITPFAATQLVTQSWLLARWPGLHALFKSAAIPIKHMETVLDLTEGVDAENRGAVEKEIIDLLTPNHYLQQLPSVRSITYRIKKIIERIQPNARPLGDGEEKREGNTIGHAGPEISFDQREESRTKIFIGLPKADGIVFEKAIKTIADTHDCTLPEALMILVEGKVNVQVTLNLYKNTADPTEDIFAEGSWIPKAAGEKWMQQVGHLAAPGYAESAGYQPSYAIKAAVVGRDGGCRAPGCSAPPFRCDVDHVARYNHDDPAAGGPTNTDNLHLLCRYHHRLKTAGVLDVELRPDGTECWTSVGDGHKTITTPYGPLGRETFERRHVRRTTALHLHNEEELGI